MTHKRTKFLHFRVSPFEKQSLEILADIEQRSASEMMRELIREGLLIRGLDLVSLEKLSNRLQTSQSEN
jgi:hypothetical protein